MGHCPTCGRRRAFARLLLCVAALLTGAAVGVVVHLMGAPDWAEVGFGLLAGLNALLLIDGGDG